MAWQDIAEHATKEKSPAGFTAKVGAVVPNTLMTYPVPISTSKKVPELRRYQYALLDSNRLLIVNPDDNKVADVVMKTEAAGLLRLLFSYPSSPMSVRFSGAPREERAVLRSTDDGRPGGF
jgi:hypothetical protein